MTKSNHDDYYPSSGILGIDGKNSYTFKPIHVVDHKNSGFYACDNELWVDYSSLHINLNKFTYPVKDTNGEIKCLDNTTVLISSILTLKEIIEKFKSWKDDDPTINKMIVVNRILVNAAKDKFLVIEEEW